MSASSSAAEPRSGYIELRVAAGAESAWSLSAELEARGALGVSLQPRDSAAPLLEPAPGATPLWQELILTALFTDSATASEEASRLRAKGLAPELVPLHDCDWIAAGRAGFTPRQYGRLWIVPDWCAPPEGAASVVRLAPGLAFGTGMHPTTALCLEWLADAELDAKCVIDYGAGSGILALAAARLGARDVTAVDNDPQALEAVRINAVRNGLAIEAVAPEALRVTGADLVISNILARPLIALAGELISRLRAGGHLVLAGIAESQADVVAAAYAGLARLDGLVTRDGWARLELRKTP